MNALSASVSDLGRLAEHALRHRLDAVDAGAEVDAIQVQLEDLLPWSAAASISTASTASRALRA